jgi:hypothetical protein
MLILKMHRNNIACETHEDSQVRNQENHQVCTAQEEKTSRMKSQVDETNTKKDGGGA